MRIYLLRHGLAGDRSDWAGDDFSRPLTAEGIKKMEREAKTIAALDLDLEAIVTSPLVRARQTAEIVAAALTLQDRLSDDPDLGFDFNPSRLANVLTKHSSPDAILLVGHEPSLSATIGQLIGGAKVEMKKGALACVELAHPSLLRGELLWLLPPKVLALR